jgi:hypothetical protein
MIKRASRQLVVDTSIIRSAGPKEAANPTSKHCRDTLVDILTICHHIVMTPDIQEEWNKHQSGFARTWRVSMVAHRKLDLIRVAPDTALRERLQRVVKRSRSAEAMLKDCRLIEAAMSADQIVLSLDETVRALFAGASHTVGEIGHIIWVNPDIEEDKCAQWLADGAKQERPRQLKSHVQKQ